MFLAVTHLTVVTLCAAFSFIARPGSTFFSWHPFCMVLAYGLLMPEAILIFNTWNWSGKFKKQTKITLHWVLQVSTLLLALTGFGIVFYNKILLKKDHFVTWHSKIGVATLAATCIECLGGILSKYPGIGNRVIPPLLIKTLHAFSGCITFAMVSMTLITGMNSNWFLRHMNGIHRLWKICLVFPPFIATLVAIQVILSYMPRFSKKPK